MNKICLDQKIFELKLEYDLTQLISEPTHVTEHSNSILDLILAMRGSRKFCQMGSKKRLRFFFFFFLVDEGIEDPNTIINGPSSARQRNAIYMAFRWRADGGPALNADVVAF